jgi:hypothetical protein
VFHHALFIFPEVFLSMPIKPTNHFLAAAAVLLFIGASSGCGPKGETGSSSAAPASGGAASGQAAPAMAAPNPAAAAASAEFERQRQAAIARDKQLAGQAK